MSLTAQTSISKNLDIPDNHTQDQSTPSQNIESVEKRSEDRNQNEGSLKQNQDCAQKFIPLNAQLPEQRISQNQINCQLQRQVKTQIYGHQENTSTENQNQNQSGNQSDRRLSPESLKSTEGAFLNQITVEDSTNKPEGRQNIEQCLFQTPKQAHINIQCPESQNKFQRVDQQSIPQNLNNIAAIPEPIQLPELNFKNVKNQQQLKSDFEQNEKILASLSFNIDDLFKKISSLTQEVKIEIANKPTNLPIKNIQNQKVESPRRKIQVNSSNNSNQNLKPKTEIKQIKDIFAYPRILPSQEQIVQSQTKQLSMKMFEIGQSLGHGKFGQVLQCRHKQTGFLFALKKIFKSTIEQYRMTQQFLVQLQACKRMNHPNIVKSYVSFTDDFHIFLINQYAYGNQLIKKFKCSQEEASKIIYQVLNALKYIHDQGVVHRDLKPENIIIDQSGVIKICDFGWSSLLQKQQQMNILCGTLDYVSPEMANGLTYTKEVDLWSVGVLTYQLIFGQSPFKAENKAATFKKVINLQYALPGAYRFTKQCIDFIQKLLQPERQRIKVQQCLSHPFITNYLQNKIDDLEFLKPKKQQKPYFKEFQELFSQKISKNEEQQTKTQQNKKIENDCQLEQIEEQNREKLEIMEVANDEKCEVSQ